MPARRPKPAAPGARPWIVASILAALVGTAATLFLGYLFAGGPRVPGVEFALSPVRAFEPVFGDVGIILGPAFVYGSLPVLGWLILRGAREEK